MSRRVTRDIDPAEARDLLERVPRAALAFADDAWPTAEPAAFALSGDRYRVGLASRAERRPVVGQEVVLLIDEGVHFFDLRAIYIRARVAAVDARERDGRFWFTLTPTKVVAWDYGRLREVDDEP